MIPDTYPNQTTKRNMTLFPFVDLDFTDFIDIDGPRKSEAEQHSHLKYAHTPSVLSGKHALRAAACSPFVSGRTVTGTFERLP